MKEYSLLYTVYERICRSVQSLCCQCPTSRNAVVYAEGV